MGAHPLASLVSTGGAGQQQLDAPTADAWLLKAGACVIETFGALTVNIKMLHQIPPSAHS